MTPSDAPPTVRFSTFMSWIAYASSTSSSVQVSLRGATGAWSALARRNKAAASALSLSVSIEILFPSRVHARHHTVAQIRYSGTYADGSRKPKAMFRIAEH